MEGSRRVTRRPLSQSKTTNCLVYSEEVPNLVLVEESEPLDTRPFNSTRVDPPRRRPGPTQVCSPPVVDDQSHTPRWEPQPTDNRHQRLHLFGVQRVIGHPIVPEREKHYLPKARAVFSRSRNRFEENSKKETV